MARIRTDVENLLLNEMVMEDANYLIDSDDYNAVDDILDKPMAQKLFDDSSSEDINCDDDDDDDIFNDDDINLYL